MSTGGSGDRLAEETIIEVVVPPGQAADTRIDVYLTKIIANATRTKVQRGIKNGRVVVNGQTTKPSYVVQPGDRIVCRLDRPPPVEAEPEDIPLSIVFEDDDLIVLDKVAGMVVHPAYGHRSGTLVNALLYHTGSGRLSRETDNEQIGLSTVGALPSRSGDLSIRPGLVHRLDKDTSGLMVVAKNDTVHAQLAQQFYHRTIKRQYCAIVWGRPEPQSGEIDEPLGRDPRDRKKMAVVASGKPSLTLFETSESHRATSVVRFRLKTGRTHQIRVHAASIGNPIFGDPTYGGREIRIPDLSKARKRFYLNLLRAISRQALHAETLGFRHPATGEDLHFKSELPDDMDTTLGALRSDAGTGASV